MSLTGSTVTRTTSNSPLNKAPQSVNASSAIPSMKATSSQISIVDSVLSRCDSAVDSDHTLGVNQPSAIAPFQVSGRKDLGTGTIYKYTIKAIDLRTGKNLESHKVLLREQVIGARDLPANLYSMGNTSFVSDTEWRIAGSDVADIVVFAELHESTDLSWEGRKKSFDGFVQVGSGPKARWIKFERTKVSASRPANDDLQQLREDHGTYSENRRHFAVTFDRKQVALLPAIEPNADPNHTQLSKDDINHFIASELKSHILEQPGLSTASLHIRGDCVFGLTTDEVHGVERRHGLRASLSLSGSPPTAQLIWTPLKASPGRVEKTANFFKDDTVCVFLLNYFRTNTCSGLNEAQVRHASCLLKGVRVIVAVKAADRPRLATIRSLGFSARSLPVCLQGTTIGDGPVERLQFPDLPCINVGTAQKPVYYPAELCKILQDQSFSGPLPKPVDASRFVLPPTIVSQSIEQHHAKNGDPFCAVKPSDFAITFARLSDADGVSVDESAWNDFQHELGQRYQAKLAQSVLGAKHFSGNIVKLREYLLHRDFSKSSIKTVIVVAAPARASASEIDALKTFCAVKVGAQVQVVAASEINRRSKRDPANKSMVMYTGQIAKKLFARALIPGTPDEGSKLATDLDAFKKRTPSSRIFGINLQFLQVEPASGALTSAKRTHLITVVSATGKTAAVHTTTSLCTTRTDDHLSDLLASIETAFKAHVTQHAKPPSAEAVIYISGLPSISKARFETFSAVVYKATPLTPSHKKDQPAKQSNFTLVAISRETHITIPASDTFLAISPLTDAEVRETNNNVNVGHLVLAHNYRKPAGYMNAHGELRDATTLWRALRRKTLPGGAAFKTEELLMRAREPSISQLAALANKRAKGRVVTVDGKLEIAAVKAGLEGSLWYL